MKTRNFKQWTAAAVMAAVFALAATLWVAGAPQQKKPKRGTEPPVPSCAELMKGVPLPPGMKSPCEIQMPAVHGFEPGETPLEIEVEWEWRAKWNPEALQAQHLSCTGNPSYRGHFRGEMQPAPAGPGMWAFRVTSSEEAMAEFAKKAEPETKPTQERWKQLGERERSISEEKVRRAEHDQNMSDLDRELEQIWKERERIRKETHRRVTNRYEEEMRKGAIATGSVGTWSCKDTRDPNAKPSGIGSQVGFAAPFFAYALFGSPGPGAAATGMLPPNLRALAGLNISVLGGGAGGVKVLTSPDGEERYDGLGGFSLTNEQQAVDYLQAAGLLNQSDVTAGGVVLDVSPPFVLTSADFENAKGFVKTFRFSKSGVFRGSGGTTGTGLRGGTVSAEEQERTEEIRKTSTIIDEITGTITLRYKGPKMTIKPLDEAYYDEWKPIPEGKDPEGYEALFGPEPQPLIFLAEIKPNKDASAAAGGAGAKGSSPATGAEGVIDFYLTDVSRHKGKCGNYPSKDKAAEKDDLRFAKKQPVQPDFKIKIKVDKDGKHARTETQDGKEAKVSSAKIAVEARDTGAYGKIRAECKECSITAKYERTGGSEISIPKDEDENHIADSWEKDYAYEKDRQLDDEPRGGQASDGDGLTLYEEYRGFVVLGEQGQKKHLRTNPREKEVFVIDESNLLNAKLWSQATGITALRLDRDLIQGTETEPAEVARLRKMTGNFADNVNFDGPPEDKLVDFNSGPDDPPGKKYAITILAPDTDDESCVTGSTLYYGKAKGAMVSLIFTARVANKVRVGCRKQAPEAPFVPGLIPVLEMAATDLSGEGPGSPFKQSWWPYNITFQEVQAAWGTVMIGRKGGAEAPEVMEFIRRYTELTVIHEVGHAVGIPHHAPKDYEGEATCPMRYFDASDNRHVTIDVLRGRKTGAMLGNRNVFCPAECWGKINLK